MAKYKIAIVGAGPAGCTLARLLLHRKVDVEVTVFEGEKTLDARTQGGSLDLHTDTGIKALQECGLHDEFLKFARFDGEAMRLTNKYYQSFLHMKGAKDANSTRGRPEIDRMQLRHLLVDALPAGVIRWNHHLTSVEEKDGVYHLNFREQPSATGFDLVVGGDGCWSHVRNLLTDEKPHYAGIAGLSFEVTKPKERCPEVYARVEQGSLFAMAENRSVMAQQQGSGNIHAVFWAVQPEDWITQFDGKLDDIEAVKKVVLEQVEDWDPRLKELIEVADANPRPRNLYMLPVGNTWEHRRGVTLLGDAAHVMTPFAGEGVNLAMTDAMKLAQFIETAAKTKTSDALDTQIKAYEEDMFKRAKKVQQMTFDMMTTGLLDEGSMDKNIEKYVMTAVGDEMPRLFRPILGLAVKGYFAVWRMRNPLPKKV